MPRDTPDSDEEVIHRVMAGAMLGRRHVFRLSAELIRDAMGDDDAMLALIAELEAAAEKARDEGACVYVITNT